MKKVLIAIALGLFLTSCGIQFGNYERYQEVHGKKCK